MTTDYENERNEQWLSGLLEGLRNSNQAAEDMANKLYKFAWASGPHIHAAGNLAGKPTDECALCGHDLRHEIHTQL